MRANTNISNVIEGNANKSKYDAEVKKVLSDKTILAWIMRYTINEMMEYKITRYKMTKEDIYGYVLDEARYDLLEVVIVSLGREETASTGMKLHGLLTTLLSEDLRPNEKKKILEQEYGIATSVELEGGIQGTFMTLISLVKDGLLSEENAAGRMGLSVEAFRALEEEYNKENHSF